MRHNRLFSVVSVLVVFMFALLVTGCTKQAAETTTEGETPAAEQPAAAGATSGWKTYTNTAVGYSIQYPAGWVVDSKGGASTSQKEVTIRSPKKDGFGQVTIGMELGTFEQVRTSLVTEHKATETQITFAGQPAYQFSFESIDDDVMGASGKVYIPHNDMAFYVKLGSFEVETENKIANTFRFR